MYKTMHKLAPENLRLFIQRQGIYNLRNLEGKLALPKRQTNYLKTKFLYYSRACLRNNLPEEEISRRYLTSRIPIRQSCQPVVRLFTFLKLYTDDFPCFNRVLHYITELIKIIIFSSLKINKLSSRQNTYVYSYSFRVHANPTIQTAVTSLECNFKYAFKFILVQPNKSVL